MSTSFLNYVPEALLHPRTNASGKPFWSLSINCPDSKNGFGSIAVSPGQVFDTTLRNGTVKPGFKNVLLGEADRQRNVSICTGRKKYETVTYTNAEIRDMVDAQRKAWHASHTAAKKSDFDKVR